MDSRGIPIVIPAKKCNTTPKRITTPKRYDTPLSPFFVRSIKNEFSLLDAYDDFYDSRFSSRYHPTSDDMRHNVRDLYKSNMFTEISSPRPPKRMRSSFFMDSDMMDDELLPHLEASKKPKDMTVSSPMEAMTPLAEDALDSLEEDEAQPEPHLPSQSAITAAAVIPRPTRSKHVQEETLVEQSQHREQIVTPKSPLKHQKQVKSAPQLPPAPLPLDNSMNGMRTRQTSARLKQPPAAAAAKSPVAKPTPAPATAASPPQRLTRRQARLIEQNGGLPDFAVPVTPLPPPPTPKKRKGRAPKSKEIKPKQVEAIEPQPEQPQPLHETSVQKVLPVEIQPEQTIVEQQQQQQQQEPQQVVNADDVADVDMLDVDMIVDDAPEKEAAVAVAEEAVIEEEVPVAAVTEEENAAAMIEEKVPPAMIEDEEPAAMIEDEEPAAMIEKEEPVAMIEDEEPAAVVEDEPAAAAVIEKEDTAAMVEKEDTAAMVEKEDTAAMIEEKQENQPEPTKAEKSEKELQEEKLRAYRKKKSDAEIKQILQEFPQLGQYYELIERAGSGTFSRVYKAKDLLVDEYMPSSQAKKVSDALGQEDADAHYVAIKLIFDISTPERVANEIRCLSLLEDSPGITPLITAFRHEGLTFVVLPYIQFDHFDDFYRDMTADDVKSYVSELLVGLKSLHEKGYMHRDVKPGNFLYNVKSKTGYLADFGLARASSLKTVKAPTTTKVKNTQYAQNGDEIGYYAYDSRSPLQADRSGTKGFRAPEVMLRYRYQTSAIDIWAVGVILLTILSGQYPIFEPEDDANGIIELAHVFGMKQLKEFTEYYGRIIHTNIPTIPDDPVDLGSFCRDINKKRVEKWDPQDYASAVDLMKQCLQLIHTNRPTAVDALNHPFFATINKHH